MASNVERRRALADAGLSVLARDGARGLTHRAVDRRAGVPEGTAANYFRSRDALLGALGDRIMERLQPDPTRLAELEGRDLDPALFAEYMRDIVERTTSSPELTLALFELRLEARRRPDLAAALGETLRRGFREDVAHATSVGFDTEPLDIALFHFAINGLLLDVLTPSIDPRASTDELVDALVSRLLGPAAG